MNENEFLEEVSAEEQDTLKEQDLLDGEEQETLEEQDLSDEEDRAMDEIDVLEEQPEPTPEQMKESLAEKDTLIKKNDKIIMGMLWALGVLTILLTFCVSVIFAQRRSLLKLTPFEGLEAGQKYDKYLKLGDYTGLTYTDSYVDPTDEEILEKMQTEIIIPVTDALENGDAAIINFEGYVDGEKEDSACAEEYELTLGSGTFIDGFESGLVGKKAGEKVTLNLTFPEDYSESLAGKDVRFEVEIISGTRKLPSLDELTDEVVTSATEEEFTSADTYTEYIRGQLAEEKRETADATIKNELWKQIKTNSKLVDYPENMYEYYLTELDEKFSAYYSTYGVSDLDGFVETVFGSTTAEYVEDQIFYDFAVYTIAGTAKINVGDTELNAFAKTYGCEDAKEMMETYEMEQWELENSVLYEKVTDYIFEKAVKKE